MIRLWKKIDLLVGPDQLTREIAKLQVPPDDMPDCPWDVCALADGSIRFWRDTLVSAYVITVHVKRKQITKRKG
jgi:hypothetical protein